jgi:transposase
MPRTKPWTVSDEFWEKVQPLIPAAPSRARGGRPRMSDRKAFEAMIYVLRTGIQWNALPRELGASSTVHERFQESKSGRGRASSSGCGRWGSPSTRRWKASSGSGKPSTG